METLIVFQGTLNPSKSRFASPHDSTVGVGAGFYWFAGFFLLFLTVGVLKAFWDDDQWRGKVIRFSGKNKK
ncbi:MAG: hypothetical protein JNM78_16980 [Cyclobacteriaceae bacterium]|nr:hypothetical protein [Cyclobacteriaceae bacterium]